METEPSLSLMLEAIKMNPKFYEQLLKDVAFGVMMKVYPEYDEAQRKTWQELGWKSPGEKPVSDIDFATEKQALEFVSKLVKLGSLDAIKQYCDEHKIAEYFPTDLAGYIVFTYNDMQKQK